jgi:hypothetical protein
MDKKEKIPALINQIKSQADLPSESQAYQPSAYFHTSRARVYNATSNQITPQAITG